MEINFEKVGNQYVAEFEATADFNLHIERKENGVLEVHQRGSEEGKYDFAWSTGVNGRKVVDYDFGALVYPKYIKVISGSEVLSASVNFNEGGGSGSGSESGEKGDCIAMLTLSKKNYTEGNSISYGVVKINLNTLGIIENWEMPSEPIIKKIDYELPYVDNVYTFTMESLSVDDLEVIECTNLKMINTGVFINDDGLFKGDTYIETDEEAGRWGGTTKVWTTKDFEYFKWIVYDESTETETTNALFILNEPTNSDV